MVKAATKSGMSARTGRPLGPLTGGLPSSPSQGAPIFPSPHASRARQRSRPPSAAPRKLEGEIRVATLGPPFAETCSNKPGRQPGLPPPTAHREHACPEGTLRAAGSVRKHDPAKAPWHGHLARASQGRPGPAGAGEPHGRDARGTHGRDAHATPPYDHAGNNGRGPRTADPNANNAAHFRYDPASPEGLRGAGALNRRVKKVVGAEPGNRHQSVPISPIFPGQYGPGRLVRLEGIPWPR